MPDQPPEVNDGFFRRGAGEWEEDDTMRIHIHKRSTTEFTCSAHYMLSKKDKSYICTLVASHAIPLYIGLE